MGSAMEGAPAINYFHMPNPYLLTALACLATTATLAQQQPTRTAQDYARAERALFYNTQPLVDQSMLGPPTWLASGQFWYRASTARGSEFVLVDPVRKTQQRSARPPASGAEAGEANEIVSPDGRRAAYIRDYNLWVRDTRTGQRAALTTDGSKDFGYATDNAGWQTTDQPVLLWSPDSRKIATFRQDQRRVGNMYLTTTNVGRPTLKTWKYPLVGDKDIITIERVIVEVDHPKVVRLQVPPDARRGTLCDEVNCGGTGFDDVDWSVDGSQLAFVSTSRDHKQEKFRVADAATGAVREVFEETVATQYESGQGAINWRFLPKSNEIIWYSERDNWGHLYLYDAGSGQLKQQITKGDFVVTQLLRVDEQHRQLYFLASGREPGNPYFSYLYRSGFDGQGLTLLTPDPGDHQVSISPTGPYFLDHYSQPNVAPVSVLRNLDGQLLLPLEKADISRLTATGWRPPTPITVKAQDGQWDLYGLLFTPSNLDPARKYPVVTYIYPGPQGGSVWASGGWQFRAARNDLQALAELGFVVVALEGSCNPGRSKSFHDACYGNMAANTLADQVAGLRQLAQRYSYLDLDRAGIWGHSGGGFAAAAALFRYPDFFKVGIAESGNHDSRNYEDDWGERYVGLLAPQSGGTSNYDSQANAALAKNLKGKLLLAHGLLDNNVPPYNTMLVVEALIQANKTFDLVVFPNATHGYGRYNPYMMRRRWDYFVRYLAGAEPPVNYELTPMPRGEE